MINFAEFEAEVQTALLHLNDPTYPPGPTLARILKTQNSDDLRATLVAAIESLEPNATTPASTRGHRLYNLLRFRFIQEVPQQECSRRLALSSRHLRREQQSAIHLLAERLWPQTVLVDVEPPAPPEGALTSWRSQLKQEFSALQQHTPSDSSNLGEVIHEVVKLTQILGVHAKVQITVGEVEAGTTVDIHPAVLGQMIFVAIDKLAGNDISREVVISASRQRPWTRITVQSRPASPNCLPTSDFIVETLSVHGGRVHINYAAGWASIDLLLATKDKAVVLVVDDNFDLVHFYKRYVEGTGYEVVHASEGAQVWSLVKRRPPDLIVLDVMLPDINGWHLLYELHQHPDTLQIPVVICSVIDQATLATSLGAAAYLTKPVHRQAFIQTLDHVRLHH
jgi:CheY-like chemotaxis protein